MQKKQQLTPKSHELLNRARHGDPTATKQLRHMGLLYWEHRGHVILKRICPTRTEGMGPILFFFT